MKGLRKNFLGYFNIKTSGGKLLKTNFWRLLDSISFFFKMRPPHIPTSLSCTAPPPGRPYADSHKTLLYGVLGTFGIQLEQKIQSLSEDPEHTGFVFFPQRKMLDHLFLFASFLQPPRTACEHRAGGKHMWKYIFENSTFSGSFASLLQGQGRGGWSQK